MNQLLKKLVLLMFSIVPVLSVIAFEDTFLKNQDLLAPRSSIKPQFFKTDMEIAIKRMEIATRRKLSVVEAFELKKIIEWIKQLRATIFSDKMLQPLEGEDYSFYLERMKILFNQFKNVDFTSYFDLKFNPDIEGRGWIFQISFRQIPVFSFTYFPSFEVNFEEINNSEKVLEEFNGKPFFMEKTIWNLNPIIINGKYFSKKFMTKSGYEVNGVPLVSSNDLWINPYGHLDEHLLDVEFMEKGVALFGNDYIVQPLSERVHVSQKQEINTLERRKNLTPYERVQNSIVIGDLHSDRNGLLNILSFLKVFVITKEGKEFRWDDEDSYTFDLESMKYSFPNGLKIVQVGDIIGPLAINEEDPLLIYKILFSLQDKFIDLKNRSHLPFELDIIAGNYEIASALHDSKVLEKGFMVQVDGGKIRSVYEGRIKKFIKGREDELNAMLFNSLWESKRFKAASIVDNKIIVHGGITNELLLKILERYFLDNPELIAKYNKNEGEPLDFLNIFTPESKEIHFKNGENIRDDKLYIEDLRDIINTVFYDLFEKEKNGGVFSKINIKSKWGVLFFDFNGQSKIGSIVESRPSHYDADSYLIVPQVVGHSSEQFFNAPILEAFNGRYLNVDTEIGKQKQSNFLYINQFGYNQVTFGATKEAEHNILYDSAMVLKPKQQNTSQDTLISIQLESFNKLQIRLFPHENTAADITAILAANGIAIDKMFVDFNTLSNSGKVIYDIYFEILRTEKTESENLDEFFLQLQKDIASNLDNMQKLREKNKHASQSRIYWEMLLKGKLQNTGVLRSYFSRISDKKTEVQQYNQLESEVKLDVEAIYAKNSLLRNHSFFRVITSERFGLLHVLFRILEEEEGFKIHRVDAKTYLSQDQKMTIADDFIFISHKDGLPLNQEEYSRIKRKLEKYLDFNKIDGRALGLPSKGFEVEMIIQKSEIKPILQELKCLNLFNQSL